jgi:hypothetical protein
LGGGIQGEVCELVGEEEKESSVFNPAYHLPKQPQEQDEKMLT